LIDLLEFDGTITNLFTPNGDGINDTWFIKDIGKYPESEVFVYNIYGKLVYTKKGYTNDWQGTYNGADLPDGTYYYVLRFEDNDKISKGSLDILRSK
jgi:gliding motility-associated-like protein